ncbi:hypothetical protein QWZ16_15500 [Vibrio ostreicida]|uniref:Uncharacterized protein n=1 Tax=Vibrio ostreicida TaxID=526588 RepID=A0ABT8BYB0_9VIBR|nr:hypothetical protein [Vibrio ostreicida]MDN3611077.1 hypothetical protein [Vibrio ostreicida]
MSVQRRQSYQTSKVSLILKWRIRPAHQPRNDRCRDVRWFDWVPSLEWCL